MAVWSSTTN